MFDEADFPDEFSMLYQITESDFINLQSLKLHLPSL